MKSYFVGCSAGSSLGFAPTVAKGQRVCNYDERSQLSQPYEVSSPGIGREMAVTELNWPRPDSLRLPNGQVARC